jgi:hypothetical protein
MLDVSLGSTRQHHSLTVFALLAPGAPDLPYDLLVDAVAGGALRIGEVGEGTVPTLVAKNEGDRVVLVLDGEQLIGARQNRMTNRSILLPPHSATEIPVYCMEQGRWHFESDAMSSAPQHSPAKVRRRARETEVRHAAAAGGASMASLREAQGDVWSDVAETLHTLNAASSTHSLDAAYATAHDMDAWLAALPCDDDQVGLVAFVGALPLGMDVIGAPRLYRRLHERLLRGYIMDALEHERRAGGAGGAAGEGGAAGGGAAAGQGAAAVPAPGSDDAQHYLDAVRDAARSESPSVGLGRYRVLSGDVVGGELVDGDRVAHLSAFPVRRDMHGSGEARFDVSPVAPPSRRRRSR